MEKTFVEMSNRELFTVLTGERGIMAQLQLQNAVRDYLAAHTEDADLVTMVRWAAEENERRHQA